MCVNTHMRACKHTHTHTKHIGLFFFTMNVIPSSNVKDNLSIKVVGWSVHLLMDTRVNANVLK